MKTKTKKEPCAACGLPSQRTITSLPRSGGGLRRKYRACNTCRMRVERGTSFWVSRTAVAKIRAADAKKMLREGYSLQAIASTLNVDRVTVWRYTR